MSRSRACGLGLVALVALAIGAWLVTGCATNPVTGKKEISLVSEGQEVQYGQEGDKAVAAEYGIYSDAQIQAHVNAVGQKLARVSHRPDLEWHFQVVDNPTVNAFALPGGYIYITRGILAYLNSEAQLAGVLGHEIGHVTARHSVQQITRSQLAGIGLGVASIFSAGIREYGQLAQAGLSLLFLKYGRDDENEADALGVDYARKAGYDPREIPATYAVLRRLGEQSGQRLPTFLSTHPDPGNREARTTQLANAAVGGATGLTVNEQSYKQRLEDLVFGNDPRQGYFEGDRFYHPEFRFVMDFPAGWAHENGRTAVLAANSNRSAGMQLTVVDPRGLAPRAYVDDLLRRGAIANADGNSESIGGYTAWVGHVVVADQSGQRVPLLAVFIRRSDDRMFQILGRSSQIEDANEAEILESARSFRNLTDSARLSPQPERVHVAGAPRTGSFSSVISAMGAQALSVDETAILNNKDTDDRVSAGTLLKIVQPGRLR